MGFQSPPIPPTTPTSGVLAGGSQGGQGPNRMTPKRAPKWHPKGAKIGIFAPPKMSFDEIYVTAPKAPLGLLNALAKGKQFLLKCI